MRLPWWKAVVLLLGLVLAWGSQHMPAQAPEIPLPEEAVPPAPAPLPPPLQMPPDPPPPDLPLTAQPKSSGPALLPAQTPPAKPKSTPERPPALRVLVPLERDVALPPQVKPLPPPVPATEKTTTHFGPTPNALPLPSLTLEKTAPAMPRLRQPFVYEIVVRNVGTIAAAHLRVEDELPPGTRVLGAQPAPVHLQSRLLWSIDHLAAGAERRFQIEVEHAGVAEWKGQATLTASVSSGAKAATAPAQQSPLTFELTGPKNVPLGHAATFQIQVGNQTTKPLTNLFLRVELPAGLEHLYGTAIEADLGTLAPGQSRQVPLEIYAIRPGPSRLNGSVSTQERFEATAAADVAVSESSLLIRQTGPLRLTQESMAEYVIEVSNRDRQEARNVVVTDFLPKGLELVNISEGGVYQATSRSVQWSLGTIPPGQSRTVSLRVAGKSAGPCVNQVVVRTEAGTEAKWHAVLRVVPMAASPSSTTPGRQSSSDR